MIKIKPLKQDKYYCGPYCLKMVFDYYGKNISLKDISKISDTVISEGNMGTSPLNMVKSARHFGFNAKYIENSSINELGKYVNQKMIPVIINWFSEDEGHYSVVVGIDKKYIHFVDPEEGKTVKMDLVKFQKVWFDYKGDYANNKKDFRVRPLIIIKNN